MSGSHKYRRKNFRTPEDVLQSRRMKSSHFAQSTTMKDAPKVLHKGRLSSVRRSASPKAQHKSPSQKINSHKTKAHSLDTFPNLTSPGGKKTPPGPSQGSAQRPKSITSVKTPSLGCKVKVIPIKKCVSFAATPTISSSVSSYQSKSTNPKLREVGAEDVGEMARVSMIGGQDTSISEKGLGRSPQAENVDDEVQQQLIIEKDLVLSSQRQKRDLLDKNRNKQADLRQRTRVTLCEDNAASNMTRKNSVSRYNEMLTPQDGRESPNDNDSKLAARAQKEPNTTAEDAEAQFITRGPKCFDSLIENPIDEDDPNHASAIVRDSEVRNIPVEPHVKNFCNEQADLINDQGDQTASPLTAGNIRPVPQEEMQRDKLSLTRASVDMYEPEHPFGEALAGGPLQGSMLPESLYAKYLKDEMNFPMNSTYRLQYPLNKSTKTREMLLSLTAERQPYHLRSRRTPRQLTPSLWRPHKATIFYLPENQHHSIKESEEKPTQQQTGVVLAPIVHGGYYDARVPGHLKYGSMSYDEGIREQQFPFEHRLATSEDLAREMKRVRKFHDCRKIPPSVGSRTSETRIQPPSRIHYHMNGWFPCSSTSVLRTKYIDAVSDLKRYWFDEWHKEVTLRNSVNQNTQYVMRGRRNKSAHSESGPHHSPTDKEIRSSQKLTQYSELLPVQTLPNKSLRTSPVAYIENLDTKPEHPESDVGDTAGFEQPKQFGIPRWDS